MDVFAIVSDLTCIICCKGLLFFQKFEQNAIAELHIF